jgi:hypothetical protein
MNSPDTILVSPDILEYIEMADMYANKCTRQEEKFDYFRRTGIPWRWCDCEAAFALLGETLTTGGRWAIMQDWKRGRVKAAL